MSLNALAANVATFASAEGDGEFHTPTPNDFWLPIVGDGTWAITEQMVWMAVSVVVLSVAMVQLSKRAAIVPTKGQWLMEGFYNFTRNGIARDMIGSRDFLRFVPLLFSLFSLILLNNLFGIIPPVMFPTMSKIGFPIALTLVVYVVYHAIGIKKHGLGGYFSHMMPAGLPGWIKPVIFPLELITYFITRPLTLALRLFGNMFAGHLILTIFALGTAYLLLEPVTIVFAPFAFLLMVFMTAFEVLVAALQAYIFTILTAVYIGLAMHPEH